MKHRGAQITDTKCSRCGKMFIPGAEHLYKIGDRLIFCSYTCYDHHLTEKEAKENKLREICASCRWYKKPGCALILATSSYIPNPNDHCKHFERK